MPRGDLITFGATLVGVAMGFLFGGPICGFALLLIGSVIVFYAYLRDRKEETIHLVPSQSAEVLETSERLRNGPRVLIDLTKCLRGECIRFRSIRDEPAIDVTVKTAIREGLTLNMNPSSLASLHKGEPQECFAFLAQETPGYSTTLMDVSAYLKSENTQLRLVVLFRDVVGSRYQTQFDAIVALTGEIQLHSGECQIATA